MLKLRRILLIGSTFGAGFAGYSYLSRSDGRGETIVKPPIEPDRIASRLQNIGSLRETKLFDLLVIGGGATGSGVALDAAARGLNVAMVEREDFAAGTSSRSTKMLHGGVRYLETAIKRLDYGQWELVNEALAERRHLLVNAAHLSRPLQILLPIYRWIDFPEYFIGMKLYDLIAGNSSGVDVTYAMGKNRTLRAFPTLRSEGLKCSVVYSDGLHNDAKMNVAIALTAVQFGAKVANHVEALSLIKEGSKLVGAKVRDRLSGEEFSIRARVIVNATGPFSDAVRRMDDPNTKPIMSPSAGVHLMLPSYFCPNRNLGLLDPKTKDGRVMFILPFEGSTLIGTTDSSTEVTATPSPTDDEVEFLLDHARGYFDKSLSESIRREDVKAAWSGIRPLALDPSKPNTAQLSRNHVIAVSESGLITVVGGKWTTYRQMAQDTVDRVVLAGNLAEKADVCKTTHIPLLGAQNYHPHLHVDLIKSYGLDLDIAEHLSHCYGDQSYKLAEMIKRNPDLGNRLARGYPYVEAEVIYSANNEYACSIVDVLARRTRLAFLDEEKARESVPRIAAILARTLRWDTKTKEKHINDSYAFLKTMRP